MKLDSNKSNYLWSVISLLEDGSRKTTEIIQNLYRFAVFFAVSPFTSERSVSWIREVLISSFLSLTFLYLKQPWNWIQTPFWSGEGELKKNNKLNCKTMSKNVVVAECGCPIRSSASFFHGMCGALFSVRGRSLSLRCKYSSEYAYQKEQPFSIKIIQKYYVNDFVFQKC